MNYSSGYPPQQGYGQPPPPGPPQGYNQYGPPQGQYGAPQGQYGAPPPGQYGAPQGQYPQQYGAPPPAPPTPASPGYIPGQQSHQDMSRAADDLRAAMKGFGTNETALINILSRLGPLEIAGAKAAFQARHRRDLLKDIHSETSGHFRTLLESLARGPLDQDCHVLHDAIQGLGTKESALNDVLLGRSNADVHAIKTHYHHLYRRTLEADVKGDLSMKTERLFDMVLAARRAEDSAPIIPQQTDQDVRDLYAATEGRTGTDQLTVCAILTARSNGQIRALAHAYEQTYRRPLLDVLRREFSGHMEDALVHIVSQAADPAKHDADALEAAMRGLGTNDAALVRRVVAVHWNPERLQQCKAAYRHFWKKELAQRIRDETSGDYRRAAVIFE